MKRRSVMPLPVRIAVALLMVLAAPLAAQEPCPAAPSAGDTARAAPSRPPDVVVRASVEARSLRFERAPQVDVGTLGCAPWDTVVVTERRNLPDPVEPGRTYRDVRVAVEIRSWLDLRCLVGASTDAVGEGLTPEERTRRAAELCARILGGAPSSTLPPDTLREREP